MTTLLKARGKAVDAGPSVAEPPPDNAILIDRRRFLAGGAGAIGAYAVAVSGVTWLVGPNKAWAAAYQVLDADLAKTLLAMTRSLYPHDFLGDVYYAKVVQDLDAEAAGFEDASQLGVLRNGAQELDAAAAGDFAAASPADREAALKTISSTPFFQSVRGKTVVSLYNQAEVWEKFGYEGPSFDKGGYIHRGFDDLSWLPDPPSEASPPVQG